MEKSLSILIPSLPERSASLAKMLSGLSQQMREGVEILVNIDSRGDQTLGGKENALLRAATGKYVVFADDDDMVMPDYVEEIFKGIEKEVDIVQIQSDYIVDGELVGRMTFEMGQEWHEYADPRSRISFYKRGCSKFCPHKRTIARHIMFEDINFVEDRAYAKALDQLCLSQHIIDHPVYEYRFNNRKI